MQSLTRIPGLEAVVRKLIGVLGARALELTLQGDAVRVGPRQLPALHSVLLQVQDVLDAPIDVPVFVTRRPSFATGAYGLERPFVVLDSDELSMLGEAHWPARMGVALGHALSGRSMYRTLLVVLQRAAEGRLPMLAELAVLPLKLALQEWARAAELSADRAALLAVQDMRAVVRMHLALAVGQFAEPHKLDDNEYLKQAQQYHAAAQEEGVVKVLGALDLSHALLIHRTAEIARWAESDAYRAIVSGHVSPASRGRVGQEVDAEFPEAPPVEVPIVPNRAAAAKAAAAVAADEARRAASAARSAVQRFADALDRSGPPKKRP